MVDIALEEKRAIHHGKKPLDSLYAKSSHRNGGASAVDIRQHFHRVADDVIGAGAFSPFDQCVRRGQHDDTAPRPRQMAAGLRLQYRRS